MELLQDAGPHGRGPAWVSGVVGSAAPDTVTPMLGEREPMLSLFQAMLP